MRKSVTKQIERYAREDKKIFLISGDAGYGVLDEYQRLFPDRYLNLGVAEQNTISFAAGLGLAGFKVFIYNIVPFVLYRCYEQVRNDICYQRLPVTLIGIGSGVTYAPGGMTHYSVEDIALARTLPNLVILSPADPLEARRAAEYAYSCDRPVYIRIAKSGEPVIHGENPQDITKPLVLQEGAEVAVLFHGSVAQEVMKSFADLRQLPVIISLPMIQPLDFTALAEKLHNVHTIITVEEHFAEGGLGSVIGEWIARENLSYKLRKMGIGNEFLHEIRDVGGMRDFYGISSPYIKSAIVEAMKNG